MMPTFEQLENAACAADRAGDLVKAKEAWIRAASHADAGPYRRSRCLANAVELAAEHRRIAIRDHERFIAELRAAVSAAVPV